MASSELGCNICSHIDKQALIPVILARLPAHAAVMQAIVARLPTM